MKTAGQQAVLMLHRVRNLLVRQRTMLVNALRAHMAKFGVIAPQGLRNVEDLIQGLALEQSKLPELARPILRMVVDQLHDTMARVAEIEMRLAKWHRNSSVATRTCLCVAGADGCRHPTPTIHPSPPRQAGEPPT